MDQRFAFNQDILTQDDRQRLREVAAVLTTVRHEIAKEWSQRLLELFPQHFTGDISMRQLVGLNEAFLALILEHLERDDVQALFETYYYGNRQLIEADIQRAPAGRISLSGLYLSARVSLQVIDRYLRGQDARLMTAYTKLTAELMMVVGQAYSDAREDYLQRAFEQINTMAHELRAPLSHLFGYLELLHAGGLGPVNTEQQHVLGQLIHETDDLHGILTGTLDLSRIDTGRVELRIEEFGLDTVFKEVVRANAQPGVTVHASVAGDVPVMRTDRVKVKQILGNLLRNAVRHGTSPISLAARMAGQDLIEITVRDSGPGIEPEHLKVIFEFFERGQSDALKRDGYGIGLHVVRRLVSFLGGTVSVSSTPGVGSSFRVTLSPHVAEPLQA